MTCITEPESSVPSRQNAENKSAAIKAAMKFFKFFCKSSRMGIPGWNLTDHIPDETSSRFSEAFSVLLSNPYHLEPITEIASIEDIITIDNPNSITDQIR